MSLSLSRRLDFNIEKIGKEELKKIQKEGHKWNQGKLLVQKIKLLRRAPGENINFRTTCAKGEEAHVGPANNWEKDIYTW